MAEKTERFGLQILEAGDSLATDGYAFTKSDRVLIDRLLELGAETHHHTGVAAEGLAVDPPQVTLDTNGGAIPAGRRVRYKITLVDENGLETAASDEQIIDTPDPITSPGAPSLYSSSVGGTLIPGVYYYALSAYQDNITSETKVANTAHITVPAGTTTNYVGLTLPSLPAWATGFNVYRRKPGSTRYYYLDSIDMDVATPPTEYDDDGSVNEDCGRTVPTTNSTFSTNAVTVTYSGATPTIPDGYTWRVYRTYISGDYENSLLAWIVEETSEGSGIITPTYDDVGIGTTTGSPPSVSQATNSPTQIDLTDMTEVQGYLPTGRNIIPHVVTFRRSGLLDATEVGEEVWVCEFDRAQIIGCRASLGKDSYPASTPVIVDVNKYDAQDATPTWDTIYQTQANRPRVGVGESFGDRTVPDTVLLFEGDALTVDIDQIGGGATPTDNDLVVNVYMVVQSESTTTTWTWG